LRSYSYQGNFDSDPYLLKSPGCIAIDHLITVSKLKVCTTEMWICFQRWYVVPLSMCSNGSKSKDENQDVCFLHLAAEI